MTSKRDLTRQMRVAAVLADDIDEHYKNSGPCGFCGDCTLGARHRVIDAIAERVRAGDPPDMVAEDYGVSLHAVIVALAVSW